MTHEKCPMCHYGLSKPRISANQVAVCPQCGYCIKVPPPWDQQPADEMCLTMMMCPGSGHVSFDHEQKSLKQMGFWGALFFAAIGAFYCYRIFEEQQLFMRFFSAVQALLQFFFALIAGCVDVYQISGGKPSIVPVPRKPPKFFDLGRPIRVILGASGPTHLWLEVPIIVGIAVVCLLGGYAAYLKFGEGIKDPKVFLAIAFGPIACAAWIYNGYQVMSVPLRIWLFNEGFARVRGNDVAIERWDRIYAVELTKVTQQPGAKDEFLTVVGSNGQQLELGKELMFSPRGRAWLLRAFESYRHFFLVAAEETLKKDGEVPFGPLQVSQQGIAYLGAVVPWEGVAAIHVDFYQVVILKKDQAAVWCELPADTIPNIDMFQTLMEKYHWLKQDQSPG